MYESLILFGATGDLSFRYLLPSLVRLRQEDLLPENFHLYAISRPDMDSEDYRRDARTALSDEEGLDPAAIDDVVERLSYARADVTDPESLKEAVGELNGPPIIYLALPPAIYPGAIEAAGRAFPDESHIVVEKPFGEDLQSAQELNRIIHERFREDAVFRVDHFLGLAAVQAIPGLRFANAPLETVWNRDHIEKVTITWDEHLGIEGRASYYDGMGALRDMVQNHLLEVLSAVAQEPPDSNEPDSLRSAKCELMRCIPTMEQDDVPRRVVHARYSAGEIGGQRIPAYVDEEGVDPAHETETFVQMVLYIDNERWRGVPFVLRTGKAMGEKRQEIAVHFRRGSLARESNDADADSPMLRIELEPPGIRYDQFVTTSRERASLETVTLRGDIPEGLPAYTRVLSDILEGDQSLSVRDDEVEELWRIVEPVMESWKRGEPPLLEYPAGSEGPPLDSLELD